MSFTSTCRFGFLFVIFALGNCLCSLVRAEVFSGNFDTNSNPIQVAIALGALAIMFTLSFVVYNYCCRALLPEGSRRPGLEQLGRGGLDPCLVETFPAFSYSEVSGHGPYKGLLECAVCLGEFEAEDKLRLLPKCSHVFHVKCVDTWLRSHSTCPLCRADLVAQSDELTRENAGQEYGPETRATEVTVEEARLDIVEGHLGKFRRSKSTGNLVKIERVEESWERHTLKLPEEVTNASSNMVTRKITRCRSSKQAFIEIG